MKKFFIEHLPNSLMKKEDLIHLNQLISTLEESVEKLEIYHEKKEGVNFDKTKKLTRNLFEKMSENLK